MLCEAKRRGRPEHWHAWRCHGWTRAMEGLDWHIGRRQLSSVHVLLQLFWTFTSNQLLPLTLKLKIIDLTPMLKMIEWDIIYSAYLLCQDVLVQAHLAEPLRQQWPAPVHLFRRRSIARSSDKIPGGPRMGRLQNMTMTLQSMWQGSRHHTKI